MADITQILQAIDQGEVGANERLLAIVYAELRAMAASQMSSERPGHTLVPTALVHEAYIRLMGMPMPCNLKHGVTSSAP